jgi:hypothetical protein
MRKKEKESARMEGQRRRHGTKTVDARWISQSAGDTLVQFIQKAHAQLNDCAAPDGLSESSWSSPISVFCTAKIHGGQDHVF